MRRHVYRCVVAHVEPGVVVELDGQASHHIARVARRIVGDEIEVIDGAGLVWPATIVASDPVAVRIAATPRTGPEPTPLQLVVGLAEYGRLDTLVEKVTEIGIAGVTVMSSMRARRVPDAAAFATRRSRLERVAAAAAKQSGRGRVPTIDGIRPLDRIIAECDPAATVMVDGDGAEILGQVVRSHGWNAPLTIIVGPDAGFDVSELDAARAAEIRVATMGDGTLRTETAGIVAAALAADAFHAGESRPGE